jgi:hypothetical protein
LLSRQPTTNLTAQLFTLSQTLEIPADAKNVENAEEKIGRAALRTDKVYQNLHKLRAEPAAPVIFDQPSASQVIFSAASRQLSYGSEPAADQKLICSDLYL